MKRTKIKIMDFGLKLKKPVMNIGFPKGKPFKHSNKLVNMNWKQTKKRFPGLSPMGDIDFDGTRNKFDCKPFDPMRDGKITDWIKKKFSEMKAKREYRKAEGGKILAGIEKREAPVIRKARLEKMRKYDVVGRAMSKLKSTGKGESPTIVKKYRALQKPVVRTVEAVMEGKTTSASSGRKAGPGRPRGVFIHTSPITGQRVPAVVYYKHLKAVRKKIRERAEQTMLKEQGMMARRGIPPQVTRMRQQARIQEVMPEQEVEVGEMPEQMEVQEEVQAQPYEVQQEVSKIPVGYRQGPYGIQSTYQGPITYPKYKIVTDLMTGRKLIKPLPPQEKWTQ